MTKKILTACSVLSITVTSLSFSSVAFPPIPEPVPGDWILVEDFESYDEGIYKRGGDSDLIFPGNSAGGLGQMNIVSGPVTNGGKAAWFWYGEVESNVGDFWHQIPLPREIPPGRKGVVFFRLWQASYDLNWHVMLSQVAAGERPEGEGTLWRDQAASLRFSGREPFVLDAHDGSSYLSSDPQVSPILEEWSDVWIVIDNDQQVYRIYRQDSNASSPELITWGPGIADLSFRNKAREAIKTLVLSQNEMIGDGMWLIDEIFMAVESGEAREYWADWSDDLVDRWIHTGDFLGEIYIGEEEWVSVRRGDLGWIYLPEWNVGPSGAWVVIPRY